MVGHPNSQVHAATAAEYGFKTKSSLHVCSNCAISRAKKKNLNKLNAHLSTVLGGRIIINISSVQNTSYGGAIFLADSAGSPWSNFIIAKNQLPETM
jgi:formylmethanofuran dehydrogenase subunit D